MADDDIVIKYDTDLGSQLKLTIGKEDEFVISAARVKPVPLAKQVEEYVKTAGLSVWHHPTDVTTAMFLGVTLSGGFDWVTSNASKNAQAVMRLPAEALMMVWHSPQELRLALQMLVIYQQMQLRGISALAFGARLATGFTISNWIFSLGGRIKGGKAVAFAKGITIFALASVGAVYRVSLKAYQEKKTIEDMGVHPFLSAIITGEDHIFNMAEELGVEAYIELRQYLLAHPESIQVQDFELELVQRAVNWFFDFLDDPKGFPDRVAAEVE